MIPHILYKLYTYQQLVPKRQIVFKFIVNDKDWYNSDRYPSIKTNHLNNTIDLSDPYTEKLIIERLKDGYSTKEIDMPSECYDWLPKILKESAPRKLMSVPNSSMYID